MKAQFIENGHSILLRVSDDNATTEVKLTQEQFFHMIRDGSRILKRRIDHQVFDQNEIDRIVASIANAEGRKPYG